MAKYDWSRLRVRVVMSVPGTYNGYNEMQDFGMCRLGRVLKEEGWVPKKDETVAAEYQVSLSFHCRRMVSRLTQQCSSLGSYGLEWWQQFYGFLSGKSIQQVQITQKSKEHGNIKVLYPSLKTVDESELGRDVSQLIWSGPSCTAADIQGGGTMFLGKSWNDTTKKLFYDANSKRGGALMHAKVSWGITIE
jgi:tyrosyl-DNA phosphodiesterase-1